MQNLRQGPQGGTAKSAFGRCGKAVENQIFQPGYLLARDKKIYPADSLP